MLALGYCSVHAQSAFEISSLKVSDNSNNESSASLLGKNKAGQQLWCSDGSNGAHKLCVNGDTDYYIYWKDHEYDQLGFSLPLESGCDGGTNHSVTGSNILQCFLVLGQKHLYYAAYNTATSSWAYKIPKGDYTLYAIANVSAAAPVWSKGEGAYSQLVRWNIEGLTNQAIDHVDVMASYDEGASWTNVKTSTAVNDSATLWLPLKYDRVRYRAVVTPNDKYKALVSDQSILTSDVTADFVLPRINIPATVTALYTTDGFTDNSDITQRTRKVIVSWNAELYTDIYGGTKIEYSVYDSDEWTELADINNSDRYNSSEYLTVPAGYDDLQFRITVKPNDTYKLFKDTVRCVTVTATYSPEFTNVALTGSLNSCYNASDKTITPTLTYKMNDDLYMTRIGKALVYYSDDEGKTWKEAGTIDSPTQEGEVTLGAISTDKAKKYQFRIGLASAVNSAINCGIENTSIVYAYSDVYVLSDSEDFPAEAKSNCDVKVTRSFVKDRKGTICLPFDLTEKQITEGFGAGAKVYEYTSLSDKVMNFTNVTTMQAGKPYIVVTAENKDSLTFYDVNISADAAPQKSSVDDNYVLCGIFSPYTMATDQTEYFLSTAGTLKYPTDDSSNKLKGYRCYFKLPSSNGAKICFDGAITGIEGIDADATQPLKVYNLNGQYLGTSLNALPSGVYIVNGKKTVIK